VETVVLAPVRLGEPASLGVGRGSDMDDRMGQLAVGPGGDLSRVELPT
jgi:hypothetical protein